jgi:hypothetical protein
MGAIKISIFVQNNYHLPAKMKLIAIFIFFLLTGTGLFAQVPLNWTIDEINPNEDLTLYPDESFFTDGVRSCNMQLNSGAVPYLISDVYNVTPGSSYEFSFDVFDNDTAGQVKVFADFYDIYGFNIFGQPPVFSSDSSEWQKMGWVGVIPDQAVVGYVLIKFYCQPDLYHFTKKANVWIDNFQFRQSGGDNLVANGSFEEWIAGFDEPVNKSCPFAVYPNPAGDFVNIDLQDDAEFIVISDLMDKEILRINVEGHQNIQIDLRHLPEGLYLTTAILGNGSYLAVKLFKQ